MEFLRGKPLTDTSILTDWEAGSGCTLPDAYKAIIVESDGGRPHPSLCPIFDPVLSREQKIGFDVLISVQRGHFVEYNTELHGRPVGLVAFGEEAGGYLFCFDYRYHQGSDPPVVLYIPEYSAGENVLSAAPSFGEFLAKLVPEQSC